MLITKISAQRRQGRYNIFLDNKYAFSASEKTVAEFVLLKGKELNAEEVEEIRQFDADAKASDLAAHYLSYEPRTIFEVLQYLKKHDISDEAANNAVGQLNELGYLD
ncbi:recombination regulator RecX, partial [Lactobacillus acidophilus]|nr:recombination regulator RecX [Lactobacillus acidophilus]